MTPDELERRLRERLDALGPAPRAELLHVLMLPDFERARGSRGDEHGDGCTRELRGRAPRLREQHRRFRGSGKPVQNGPGPRRLVRR
jgi:hypothetical protein